MSLSVADPGLFSLVVGVARTRTRSLGVSLGGPADRASWMIGNALLGNVPFATALEITLVGPTLVATADIGAVIWGAPFEAKRNGEPLEPGVPFALREGDRLRVGGTPTGARAYLCVVGGIHATQVLGSTSAFEPIRRGDVLACDPGTPPRRRLPFVNLHDRTNELRFIDGPQAPLFAPDAMTARPFVVTPTSNRMGVRLRGEPLTRQPGELVSEPVAPGTVQVTNDGQCIVLGVDGQTIGGYPKAAQVIRADVDALGQLRPGEEVRFVRVTLAEAERLGAARAGVLREWLWRLEFAERR